MSLNVKKLIYNAFQVNTYVVYHENGEALIVDPACYSPQEQQGLSAFIEENNLQVKFVINTHNHVDHLLGNGYVFQRYGIKPMIHEAGKVFFDSMLAYAYNFGFDMDQVTEPGGYLVEGQHIVLGDEILGIACTPGHADGSISIISESGRWIITGDAVFYQSIGRTDLPTGNLEKLLSSIHRKILNHPDDFVLYPGHGPQTTVGFERKNNPYL